MTPSEWLLEDFVAGLGPAHKVYIFPNAFRLNAVQRGAINERLDREKASAVWIYAPGYFEATGSAANAGDFLGMRLTQDRGETGSEGAGLLAGVKWGSRCGQGSRGYLVVDPRLAVDDPSADVLGRYLDGGRVSAAVKKAGAHRNYFFGDLSVSHGALGAVLEANGIHRWMRGGETVMCDGEWLAIHAGAGGRKRIHLPQGVTLQPLNVPISTAGDRVFVNLDREATVWFRIKKDGEKRR